MTLMSAPRPNKPARLHRVDPNLLVSLLAIFDTGNVSRAAEALGITQPAVSQNLRKLREHFGDPLFVRGGNILQPTPLMLGIRPVIARLIQDLDTLSCPAGSFDPANADREFSLCMSDSAEFAVIPFVAAEFGRRAPGCRIRGMRIHHSQLLAMLEKGEADVALGSLAGAAPSLRQQRLTDHGMVCLVSGQGRWADTPPTLDDYAQGRHVAVRRVSDNLDPVSERLRLNGIERNTMITVSSDFVAAATVVQTDALCTVARAVARQLAAFLPVRIQPLPFDVGTLATRMIWHERYQHDASHIWLRKLVRTAYRNWDAGAP
ncbi:LysR substrate-binding domain-containing protein [Bordetella bronchiseptica]|uniref:LysR substrate-binding domain-containing protein n=1 Tax=Bordetella bronchiseptica TaxID=518 RepID=UPI0009B9122A|nr:LysR substrate-binding domain-containing protein [Bordetella bronchiseptica]AUL13918.1 LysR family transcriptional regulator [Bordetella bronchiseptica]AWP57009.1 LysR family transcriptional regulator [Bordetella bronchiseptica]AWQ03778.1 LysR family transcriptional regulator [Bordetella bronchiseptica]AZW29270.1 LysR family transcriptional regulator [Bordetella bronchiseptica]QET69211.1 LysR family transcriptional regulator [Bordetella bronchiseptica]